MTAKQRVQRAGLRAFGRLPRSVRRRLVRLGSPSFYVGAMGVVVVDDRVLLVRQSYRRGWGVPGGLLDRGEAAEAAVVRELWEEVGLAVVVQGRPSAVIEPRSHRVDVCFRCAPAPGSDPASAVASSPEIDEVRWFSLGALPELQFETRRALLELGLDVPPPAAEP